MERYALLLDEFNEMKADHKRLFIRYMDVKSDNERLQRQVGSVASEPGIGRGAGAGVGADVQGACSEEREGLR